MHDPYRPPQSVSRAPGPGWFRSRPLAVYPVALLSFFPLALVLWGLATMQVNWTLPMEKTLPMAADFLQVIALFVAGLCLLYLRKLATWLYGLSFALFSSRFIQHTSGFDGSAADTLFGVVPMALAALLGYSVYLHVRGRLA